MSPHPILHVEISAQDRVAAGEFYSKVFGWQVRQIPEMDYATFSTGSEQFTGGGFNPVREDNPAGTILIYIDTDDMDASLAAIEAQGGKILAPKMEIPTVGWFAVFSDPTGNRLALLQPLPDAQMS